MTNRPAAPLSALPSQGKPSPADPAAPTILQAERFRATVDGKAVGLWTLRNNAGMMACVTNYGARIEQLLAPDRAGRMADVVQGYDDIEAVRSGQSAMGAFIGRFANRIGQGRFTLDGEQHQLTLNNGPHSIHGGTKGSRFQVFAARQLSPASVEMTHVFADGEEGYPGTMPLRVVYSLMDDALVVDFMVVAVGRATIANLTSHAYFNLSGDLGRPVLDHVLTIHADAVLELDSAQLPTGRLRPVAGTPLDFRTPVSIGAGIAQGGSVLASTGGYDHTYVLNRTADGGLQRAATVHEPDSGRVMEVWTTEPTMQFFSGEILAGQSPRDRGKGGVLYEQRSGLCLEPQQYVDAPNHSDFPSAALQAGEWRSGQIVYRFTTD